MASPSTTSVSVSATLDYNGTPIPVNSGDLADLRRGNFQFTLTQPVVLGSIQDFLEWLQRQFGLPDLNGEISDVIATLKNSGIGIVVALGKLLEAIYTGIISITVLVINTTSSTYKIGVTMQIGGSPDGFNLFDGLNLNSIGFLVAYQ